MSNRPMSIRDMADHLANDLVHLYRYKIEKQTKGKVLKPLEPDELESALVHSLARVFYISNTRRNER